MSQSFIKSAALLCVGIWYMALIPALQVQQITKKSFSDGQKLGLCCPKTFIFVPHYTGCKMDVSYYDDLKQNLRHEKTCVACRLMIFGNYIQARLKLYEDLLKMIIPQAVTGVYHPLCFCCSVCTKPLGEENYSLDSDNKVNLEQLCTL